MELCAAITGCYLGWVILAIFPRRVVRPSRRILQDMLVLAVCSFLFPCLCCSLLSAMILAFIAFVMYNDLPAPRLGPNDRAVVITGCDQGIGHALAIHLDKLGLQVFAGCLFMGREGERSLVKAASDKLQTFQMDVTNQQQVLEGAQFVRDRLGGKVLHGLVNNAGVMFIGNMEVMSYPDIRKVFDVNTMGLIHTYRAFMPLLRQSRRGTARMVNVASNLGLAPGSQVGVYCASKAAVAILSESLRYELKPLGVAVSTIVPSGYKTGILKYDYEGVGNRWWDQASQEVRDYFGRACFMPTNKRKDYEDYLQPDFSAIVECMTDALLSTHPRPIYYKGLIARGLPFLYTHLPSCIWDYVMPHMGDFYHFPVQALEHHENNSDSSSKMK